jgi:hypothetical protein
VVVGGVGDRQDGAPVSARQQRAGVGDVMILDAIGSLVIKTEPDGDVMLMLDLEGRLNKLQVRDVHRYVMTAGQAAELLAELVVAGQQAAHGGSPLGITEGKEFAAELEAAIAAEQQRRGLSK